MNIGLSIQGENMTITELFEDFIKLINSYDGTPESFKNIINKSEVVIDSFDLARALQVSVIIVSRWKLGKSTPAPLMIPHILDTIKGRTKRSLDVIS